MFRGFKAEKDDLREHENRVTGLEASKEKIEGDFYLSLREFPLLFAHDHHQGFLARCGV